MAEFVTKKENTRRLMVVIFCIIADTLALTLIIFAWKGATDYMEGDQKKIHDPIKDLRRDIQNLRAERFQDEQNFAGWSQPIGWNLVSQGSYDRFGGIGVSREALGDFLRRWHGVLTETHKVSGLRPFDQEGTDSPLTLVALFDKLQELETQYANSCGQLETQIKTEREREVRVGTEIAAAEKALADEIRSPDGNSGLVMDFIRLLRDQYNLEKQHAQELYGDGVTDRGLEGQAIEAQRQLTELKKANLVLRSEYEAKRSELNLRRSWILHRQAEAKVRKEPDGEVLSLDVKQNVAYIDLLHRDRIFRGTRFRVYSLEKGGVKVDKGEIEVINVREAVSSVAAITRTYSADDPIKPGDKIYNEYYERDKTRHIAIAGRLKGRLDNHDASRLIQEFGDVFQEKVDEKTNYLILGEGYPDSPNYKLALEWGVKFLRERSLYDYLGVPQD